MPGDDRLGVYLQLSPAASNLLRPCRERPIPMLFAGLNTSYCRASSVILSYDQGRERQVSPDFRVNYVHHDVDSEIGKFLIET